MSASTSVGSEEHGPKVPWGDVLLSAIASVSWALIGMAGTAALGLRLLDADAAGSLGPMTAAVVALGAGGSVTPAGDVSAFGLKGAQAHTAIEITPLGVGLVGALLLSFFFLRSLRAAGVVVSPAELLARAGAVIALFVGMMGGLAWAGHDVITIDGGSLGLDDLPGGGGGGLEIPGLGDVGDIGGLLPGRIGDLVEAEAAVGFTVDTAPTLLGGLVWSAGVLLIALLASRRTPLPRGFEAVHRVVRPAVSALVTVALTAVAAGFAAAAYAAIGDDHPRRIAGAALLGAPNGVWLGVPIGLFVPWDGRATGELVGVLPAPLDELLSAGAEDPVTLGRLAELDERVWLLGVAAALMMLLAGVLTAVRTPVARDEARSAAFAGRCAVRLGVVTALSLSLLVRLTEVSVDASLSVLGVDAFGAGIDLRGHLGTALLLGAVWGAGAGAAGALLARASGAAGSGATALARGAEAAGVGVAGGVDESAGGTAYAGPPPSGPYRPGAPHRPPGPGTNPYLRPREGAAEAGAGPAAGTGAGEPEDARPAGSCPPPPSGAGREPGAGRPDSGARPPGGTGQGDGRVGRWPESAGQQPDSHERQSGDDVYGAPTVAGPLGPRPGPPRRPPRPGERPGGRPPSRWGEGPPPPPPPPPAPPRRPRDGQ
ncbi:streptophobe family protein [Streptomyces sp. NPDC017890]|uniref:streptophobe family protein n=1 Tax=Streptomyces sp. NPDC017890 TaxID=3365015 RepID=UPI0037A02B42